MTRDLLRHALKHAGQAYSTTELAIAAGHNDRANSASTMLNGPLNANAIARSGEPRAYKWFVPDNTAAKARAQAYLDKPEHGARSRDATFNGGSPAARATSKPAAPGAIEETPRTHAFPPSQPLHQRAIYPPEPLQFSIDDDGDLQVVGKITGTPYLLIPKLDAVDLLAFARAAAPIIEGAAP